MESFRAEYASIGREGGGLPIHDFALSCYEASASESVKIQELNQTRPFHSILNPFAESSTSFIPPSRPSPTRVSENMNAFTFFGDDDLRGFFALGFEFAREFMSKKKKGGERVWDAGTETEIRKQAPLFLWTLFCGSFGKLMQTLCNCYECGCNCFLCFFYSFPFPLLPFPFPLLPFPFLLFWLLLVLLLNLPAPLPHCHHLLPPPPDPSPSESPPENSLTLIRASFRDPPVQNSIMGYVFVPGPPRAGSMV